MIISYVLYYSVTLILNYYQQDYSLHTLFIIHCSISYTASFPSHVNVGRHRSCPLTLCSLNNYKAAPLLLEPPFFELPLWEYFV